MNEFDREVNVLALVKGDQRYVFLFDDENREETLRQLAKFAANPELDFDWHDAAMLSQKIRDAVPMESDATTGDEIEFMAGEEFDSLSIEDFQ
ncbi:MAG: hypothetical protein AAF664_00560 [Planctomycetota bacterium]